MMYLEYFVDRSENPWILPLERWLPWFILVVLSNRVQRMSTTNSSLIEGEILSNVHCLPGSLVHCVDIMTQLVTLIPGSHRIDHLDGIRELQSIQRIDAQVAQETNAISCAMLSVDDALLVVYASIAACGLSLISLLDSIYDI